MNNNYINETSKLNQLKTSNQQSNIVIRDRDEHIKQINIDNDIIKQNNSQINCENNKLCTLLDGYKKHLCLLVSQNKKIASEIQFLIGRDREIKEILERDNHLKDIRYENEQFVNSSKEKIRDYINGDIPTVEKTVTTTIKRTYSIDGNNDRNLMTSRNMMNIVNNNERINSMDDREINPDMNRILTQGNKLTLSQERYMDENEKEEIS